MTNIPKFSPGCFGSALAYAAENAVCRACVFHDQCKPLHEQNLASLRAHFGIVEARPVGRPMVPITNPGAMAIPKKVQVILDKLDASNLRITEKLQAGINPFQNVTSGGWMFMKIACFLLLRSTKPLARPLLAAAYMTKLGFQQNTADAHARMAYQALAHIGAIDDTEAGATLRRG